MDEAKKDKPVENPPKPQSDDLQKVLKSEPLGNVLEDWATKKE